MKNKHRRTILPKQTRTPPRPLALTESPGIKMTHDRGTGKNKKPCQKEKATDEELKSPETPRKLLEIRKGTRKTLESDVKNNPKRKRQLLRKAVGEP